LSPAARGGPPSVPPGVPVHRCVNCCIYPVPEHGPAIVLTREVATVLGLR